MNDETRLRGLLQAAVPDDASSLDPQAVSTAARHARHRNRLITLGAAAATVAVIGTIAVVASGGPEDDQAAEEPTTTAPYDAPACPATLPELEDANMELDDLTGLTSVRLCPDLQGSGLGPAPSAAEQREILADMDALIEGLDAFRGDIAAQPEPDPARCATISVMNNRQSLQFTFGERSVLVATQLCGTAEIEGHAIDGGNLATVYLAALSRQRDNLAYRHDIGDTITCDQVFTPSPAQPGREHLVAAVLCPPQGEGPTGDANPLDDDQLADLEAAWQNPGDVAEDLNQYGENTCVDLLDAPPTLVVATDHGDVVRLNASPCGWLHWDSWKPGEGKAIPTTLEDLGLR